MEAALFTLDVGLIVLLVWGVRRAERVPPEQRNLGLLSYLEAKTDEVQKGLRQRKDRPHA